MISSQMWHLGPVSKDRKERTPSGFCDNIVFRCRNWAQGVVQGGRLRHAKASRSQLQLRPGLFEKRRWKDMNGSRFKNLQETLHQGMEWHGDPSIFLQLAGQECGVHGITLRGQLLVELVHMLPYPPMFKAGRSLSYIFLYFLHQVLSAKIFRPLYKGWNSYCS